MITYFSERDMDKMVSVKDIAKMWNVTERRVTALCKNGKIGGAIKNGNVWQIPFDSEKPQDKRVKSGQYSRNNHSFELRLPVGIVDYKETIRNNYYYVDKTMLIKEFLDELPKIVLFTRPRRFGKTLTMSMLRTFFEKTDEDTSIYFKKQKIWACGKMYREFQGKFPVIFLTFKDIKKGTWEETYEGLANLIRLEYIRHKELKESTKISYPEFYWNMIDNKASRDDYEMSLKMLSQMLKEHYGTAPIIIIDEYDIPIQQGYIKGFYDNIILFMRNLFSGAFKDNENLSYGFMTGILRVAKESIFSGLNNLVVSSVLDERYSQYFGFTKDEVEKMAVYYNATEKLDEICQWYDGYRFGSTDIFNPWSVINYFFFQCKCQAYWQSTGSNEIIGEILQQANTDVFDDLTTLVKGKTLTTYIDTGVIYPQIKTNQSTIYSFLLMTGYLKATSIQIAPTGDYITEIALPNKEIRYVYNKEILQELDQFVPSGLSSSLQAALASGDNTKLKILLEKLLIQSVSFYDTAKENFYHGFILGLCCLLNDFFTTSNKESGLGRFDIQLLPKRKDLPGIIIELKAIQDADKTKLQSIACEAVKQIKEKEYYSGLIAEGIENIIVYGVAFSGKSVEIEQAIG